MCIAVKIHERVNLTFTQIDFCIQLGCATVTNTKHTLKAKPNTTTHKEHHKNIPRIHLLDKVNFQFSLNIVFSLKRSCVFTSETMLTKQQDFSIFLVGLSVSEEEKLYFILKPTFLLHLAMAQEVYSKEKKGLMKILSKT